LAQQIVLVSLASHVLSRFTGYVAVDRSEVVNRGGQQHHITQPVEVPAGWDMMPNTTARPSGMMTACFAPTPDASIAVESLMLSDP